MMKSIELWPKRARPNPTDKDFSVQLDCHFEELAEMMDTLCVFGSFDGLPLTEAHAAVSKLAELLKGGTALASIDDVNTSRLTEADVRLILKSDRGHSDLAREFNVTPCAIWHIRAGRTWKHVERS